MRVVLDVGVASVPLDCFRWFALIEHQIVEGNRSLLVLFQTIVHGTLFIHTASQTRKFLGLPLDQLGLSVATYRLLPVFPILS
jgi:hypothetical protein